MSIPNFKSITDYQEFVELFRVRWEVKLELLNLVRDDMFPGCHGWSSIPPSSLEVIDDITQSLLYDVDRQFKENHQDYRDEEDEMFIPRKSFKENVTEALLEANKKFWNQCDDTLKEWSEDAQKYYDK